MEKIRLYEKTNLYIVEEGFAKCSKCGNMCGIDKETFHTCTEETEGDFSKWRHRCNLVSTCCGVAVKYTEKMEDKILLDEWRNRESIRNMKAYYEEGERIMERIRRNEERREWVNRENIEDMEAYLEEGRLKGWIE